ncbi:MAG: sodium/glutamate symporter [Chromatiales bacterium]|jgi:ESS family glutamate:Na+ symporter
MNIELDILHSLIIAIVVLFLGQLFVSLIKPLRQYNIPVPVVGGLLFAALMAFLQTGTDIRIHFNTELRSFLMLAFFTGVGLTADLGRLKRGGISLVIFLLIVAVFLTLQDTVGALMAYLLDMHPAMGLLAGSITLSGGHGTGAAWAQRFVETQNLGGALELAVASATFGLVIGGLLGGPVSQFLISRYRLQPDPEAQQHAGFADAAVNPVNARAMLATLFLILAGVVVSGALYDLFKDAAVKLPDFIWALFVGVVLRNLLGIRALYQINEKSLDLISTLTLWLALAFTFMGLRLWELLDLAGPLFLILLVQTLLMAVFATFVTFRALGANYDAAVMAAGHCGFCMGATPTAIANMQAVTSRYGPSPQAFIVVPMIGAFFIDLINALVIQGFLSLPIHGF